MKLAKHTGRPSENRKRQVVSRTDALVLMIGAAVIAAGSSVMSVMGIVDIFSGPVTLTLPVDPTRKVAGLELGAEARFSAVDATIPALPGAEAGQLAWAAALTQVGVLAVLALLFLLAFRLRGDTLFTRGSVWIIGACGAALALAGTAGQVLDQLARTRLADAIGLNADRTPGSVIFEGNISLLPIVAGIALVLIAGVFQFGGRLQKDTEGLV
ncbi:hypothetical protein HWD94_06255 [Pseudarthrobacter equi]|uniref:hypothetical protein n=1 Tax=Pseudarthrobacter equi TaxID=728066 RepID=UPI0021BEB493|nr:hypothetical protein [Pseudarthrobacter equi]MCT9624723.1 hypothetical protein [Pseudarthrobacter equi]